MKQNETDFLCWLAGYCDSRRVTFAPGKFLLRCNPGDPLLNDIRVFLEARDIRLAEVTLGKWAALRCDDTPSLRRLAALLKPHPPQSNRAGFAEWAANL